MSERGKDGVVGSPALLQAASRWKTKRSVDRVQVSGSKWPHSLVQNGLNVKTRCPASLLRRLPATVIVSSPPQPTACRPHAPPRPPPPARRERSDGFQERFQLRFCETLRVACQVNFRKMLFGSCFSVENISYGPWKQEDKMQALPRH